MPGHRVAGRRPDPASRVFMGPVVDPAFFLSSVGGVTAGTAHPVPWGQEGGPKRSVAIMVLGGTSIQRESAVRRSEETPPPSSSARRLVNLRSDGSEISPCR